MKISIKKLETVSLLLEIENPQSDYPLHALEAELKDRNLDEAQLKKAYDRKNYVLQQRTRKAEAPLSIMYKVFLVAVPFTNTEKMLHRDTNMISDYEGFIEEAGYQKKAQEIKKYRRISLLIWVLIFLTLNLYVILT